MPDLEIKISETLAAEIDDVIAYLIKSHIVAPKDADTLTRLAYHIQEARHFAEIKERLREIAEEKAMD